MEQRLPMAFDLERENVRHAAGWRGFVVFMTVSAIAAASLLLLMAALLL
jgi:hypothetical protein